MDSPHYHHRHSCSCGLREQGIPPHYGGRYQLIVVIVDIGVLVVSSSPLLLYMEVLGKKLYDSILTWCSGVLSMQAIPHTQMVEVDA